MVGLRGTEEAAGLLSLDAGLGGATRGLAGMVEVAAGFVGFGIVLRGAGMAGVRVALLDRDEGAADEDLCCVGGFILLGLAAVVAADLDVGGAGMALETGAGLGNCEGFLFTVGSLEDGRGMPRGMPVGLAAVCGGSMFGGMLWQHRRWQACLFQTARAVVG